MASTWRGRLVVVYFRDDETAKLTIQWQLLLGSLVSSLMLLNFDAILKLVVV